MKKQKKWIRLTEMMLEAVCQLKTQHLQKVHSQLENFCQKCTDVSKDSHLFDVAVERNWSGAAERIRSRISRNLNDFAFDLQRLKEIIDVDRPTQPKLSDIFAEFNQIEQDLGQFKVDLKEKTISVITDPITLDDISLGSFEIKLDIGMICRLYTESPYRIIALEPNPAGSNENVTHPHVSDEYLCEGDGHVPIRMALEEGRVCDFFMMIAQILQTYNPHSPYVALSDWDGYSCYDCGYTVGTDDSYYCENCGESFCDECSGYCKICDDTLCRGCLRECPDCQEPVCKHCFGVCQECERGVCTDCLEENICQTCIENRKENQDEETKQNESDIPMSNASVQSDGMGQTRISA